MTAGAAGGGDDGSANEGGGEYGTDGGGGEGGGDGSGGDGRPSAGADAIRGVAASPLATALATLARQSAASTAAAAPQTSAVSTALQAQSTLEERLRRVDEAAASAKAERGPPPEHVLQEHMLRCQREADERAAKQLQAEVRRLREGARRCD